MHVQNATPPQIRNHIADCGTCQADPVLIHRLDLFNKADGDPCEQRFLGPQVDERVGDLHGGFITA